MIKYIFGSIFFAFFMIITVFSSLGYRINTTPSLPKGLWKAHAHIEKRGFVQACPSAQHSMIKTAIEHGYLPDGSCPGGFAPLLKQVIASEGDTVKLHDNELRINDKVFSVRTMFSDPYGPIKPVERGTYVLGKNEYWVLAEHHASFDSRYFGVVRRDQIISGMSPVWTW